MKKLLSLIIFYIFSSGLSFSQVTVTLQQPAPYKFNIASMWNITLNNTTNTTYNVELLGEAKKSNGEFIASGTTSKFILKPGMKIVNAAEIQPISVKYGSNGTFKKIIERTGSFPAGDYDICVYVKNTDSNNATLGFDCIPVSVQNFSQLQLISPMDGADINDMYPVFSWLPPSPVDASMNLNYTLSIYEILARQTPYDAVVSNPAFFEFEKIKSTVFRYPAVSRKFSEGNKYAVQVKAYAGNVLISESEINFINFTDTIFQKNIRPVKKYSLFYNENNSGLYGASNSPDENHHSPGKIKPLKFGLSSKVTFEASDKPGKYSNLKNTYGRIDLIPRVSVYDIPISMDIFIATDQSSARQDMNSFASYFNSDILNDFIKTKIKNRMNAINDEVERKVKEKGEQERTNIENKMKDDVMKNLSTPLKIFTKFQNLGIGDNYPKYTDYTVSGISVTGVNFEFNPGLFYLALTGPLNNKAIENKTFKRNLYSGRIGVGRFDNSHLFFTMMYAKDYENSIKVADTSSLTPKENYLFETEGRLSLLNNKLDLTGDIGISFLTDDTQAEELVSEDIPEFVKNILHPKVSSRIDGFYKIGTAFKNESTNTNVKASVLMVGPGYLSLGSPTKKNDKLEFEISADQKFLNNQLTAKVSFKTGRDNLLEGFKKYTTKNSLLNINLSARFRNLPSVTINYYPVFLSNDATNDSAILDNLNQNLTIVTSYPFRINNISNNSSLVFTWNAANTHASRNDSYNWSMYLANSVSFNNPFFLTGSFGLLKSGLTDTLLKLNSFNTYTLDFNAGYTFFEEWQNSVGVNFSSSPDENKNLLFYLSSNTKILKFINVDLRLEKSIFKDYRTVDLDRNELIFKANLSADLN